MRNRSIHLVPIAALCLLSGCSGSEASPVGTNVGGSSAGGVSNLAGAANTGGANAQAGTVSLGGTSALGTRDTSTIGSPITGGAKSTGGAANTGGLPATGGAAVVTGGTQSTGGAPGNGGAIATGGKISTGGAGGAVPTGGSKSTGGASPTGGSKNTGGVMGTGGNASGGAGAGGKSATGGALATGGSATGSGGSTAYHPCPSDGTACKILPLGDSIAFGVGDEANAGYRGPLFALTVTAGKKITFTGSVSNGPATVSGQTFPKRNEGHSGWGISTITTYSGGNAGIATVIPSPALDSGSGGIPNIILMMIGTNDANETGATAAAMTTRLVALIDKIIAATPNSLLVVAKITPLSWASTVINAYNTSIPGLVQTRAAAGKHVVLADMNNGFNASTMFTSDNIHPNTAGYKFMADQWYSVISSALP